MIEIKGRKNCKNCFAETTESICSVCGYDPDNSAGNPTLLVSESVILGRYIIETVIGKGGFRVTYLVFDNVSEKKAAIKEYFPYSIARRTAGEFEGDRFFRG